MSRAQRRSTRGSARQRGRRTPVRAQARAGGLQLPWIPIAVVVGVAAIVALAAYVIWQQGKEPSDDLDKWRAIESDPAPSLPGTYVNLPDIYKDAAGTLAHYGQSQADGPNTNAHVTTDVDYSVQNVTQEDKDLNLPPAGGPHWGSGACGGEPTNASAFCGPVSWGFYTEEWDAASLVHNMEHGGVVVWYNTANQDVIDETRDFIVKRVDDDNELLVMAPYDKMGDDLIVLTAWGRRQVIAVDQFNIEQVRTFVDRFKRRFNPEHL